MDSVNLAQMYNLIQVLRVIEWVISAFSLPLFGRRPIGLPARRALQLGEPLAWRAKVGEPACR
ncbi:MAG: hypothetical protein A2V86_11405 [Deltaproteobacteria bacterium RBG_16_49_23]|nr:MAG: hypothetical protein A2V86_11405 [Deltaproteobacteria bacterium RBG_16_49_23]